MKKLISLIIFVGLAINIKGQNETPNGEGAMVKVNWLIGEWEGTGPNGNTQQVSYKSTIKTVAMSITTGGRMQNSGVLGFDRIKGKLVGKSYSRRGHIDTVWSFADDKIIEKLKLNVTMQGENREFNIARSYRSVDKNTMEMTMHRLNSDGELGEVMDRFGTTKYKRKNLKGNNN